MTHINMWTFYALERLTKALAVPVTALIEDVPEGKEW